MLYNDFNTSPNTLTIRTCIVCTIELRAVDSPSSLEMVQAGLREP